MRAQDALETPRFWRFDADGWGELRCCLITLPVLERRTIWRQDHGDNDERLLGLPYFIEPGVRHPLELVTDPGRDDAVWLRLHHWAQDHDMAALRQ